MKRTVIHGHGDEIDKELLRHIQRIEKQAFAGMGKSGSIKEKEHPEDFLEIKQTAHFVCGKDWYMIYNCPNTREIEILELARVEACKGEGAQHLREIVASLRELVETDKIINTCLKEDTSYPLYLISKKRGIVEQIGDDEVYYFHYDFIPRMVISEEKQEKLYKKLVKERKYSSQVRMHLVSFAKKG